MTSVEYFFDLTEYPHARLFEAAAPVWAALKGLKEYMASMNFPVLAGIETNGAPLPTTIAIWEGEIITAGIEIEFGDATKGKLKVMRQGEVLPGASVIMAGVSLLGSRILLGKGVLVEPGAYIKSPVVIGDQSEVRQGAYLRGHCLTGKRCVLGHVTEVKHSIFLNDAKAGHFAYVGDSILGNRANLGAGTKLANLRFLGDEVTIRSGESAVGTGLKKLGAILGDDVQTGCNSVTNPGTLLGKKSMLMPNMTAPSGYHPPGTMLRS